MTSKNARLRLLPQVEKVLAEPSLAETLKRHPRALVVGAAREVLAAERARLLADPAAPTSAPELAAHVSRRVEGEAKPRLKRVLNATGVVLHTNLGRAPLGAAARRAVNDVASGYSSLELDLSTGKRGERGAGVERWLVRLTGAEAALVVNNGAAAVLLVLSALAAGRKVAVSRGELVEIGGSFRVPEIMEKSGATLVEVGSTNRTHLRDYEKAFERHKDLAAILRVHPSNFRIGGFTARPGLEELAKLARKRKVPLLEDLGSGALVDFAAFGLDHEPTVGESLAAGADVVTFSGDKLLGGGQAGLVLGWKRLVDKARKDPLARALRADKLALAALEATLPLYADPARAAAELPALDMLRVDPAALRERAERLAEELRARVPDLSATVVMGSGEAGGGALPLQELPGWIVEVAHPARDAAELERLARASEPPVIGTLRGGRYRLDVRTLTETEIGMVATALGRSWG